MAVSINIRPHSDGPAEGTQRSSVAEETAAMGAVMAAIETLDPAAQARVLNHAMGRLNELHPERLRGRT